MTNLRDKIDAEIERFWIFDLRFWIGLLDDTPKKNKAIFPALKACPRSTILRVLCVLRG